MFKYEENKEYTYFGYGDEDNPLKILAKTTSNLEEIKELLKIKNALLNRDIAKNPNLTEELIEEMLLNYSAYTMNTILAKHPKMNEKLKDILYDISDNQYKASMLKKDLNDIFNKS